MMKHTLLFITLILMTYTLSAQVENREPLQNHFEIEVKYKKSIGQQTKNSQTGKNQLNAQEFRISYLFTLSKDILGGFGLGFAGYHNPTYKTLPLDARMVVFPIPTMRTIAIDIGLGYTLPIERSFKSGHRANIGLTWRPNINDHNDFGLAVGFSRQQFRNIVRGFNPGTGAISNNVNSDEFYIGVSYAL